MNSKTGGGKTILDNYMFHLSKSKLEGEYYILTPNYDDYKIYASKNIKIIDIHEIYKKNYFFLLLYYYKFPKLISQLKIDIVFNFGDIVLPIKRKQIYYFDWAYAVYNESYVWKHMSWKDLLIRKLKIQMIDWYIKQVHLIFCQTANMSKRLHKKYHLDQIKLLPTPLGVVNPGVRKVDIVFQKDTKYFIYPANFSPHKNFKLILEVANLIKEYNLPFVMLLTLDKNEASDFLQEVYDKNLSCIYNIGKVSREEIYQLYTLCDALLFPSLLESYGLPYVEAMTFNKPILTSDLDFAHSVCGDVAFYFDPFKASSVLDVMMKFDQNKMLLSKKLEDGSHKMKLLPTWDEFFFEFETAVKN